MLSKIWKGNRLKPNPTGAHSRHSERLKAATDLGTAQEHLGNLNREVRKQKSEQDVITKTTETSQHFRGMDADQLASELKDLTEQAEIPPELQAELQSLFERLADSLPDGTLRNAIESDSR